MLALTFIVGTQDFLPSHASMQNAAMEQQTPATDVPEYDDEPTTADSVSSKQAPAHIDDYCARAGDTLANIAIALSRKYGIDIRWQRLHADNRDRLNADPDVLEIGDCLRITQKSASTAEAQAPAQRTEDTTANAHKKTKKRPAAKAPARFAGRFANPINPRSGRGALCTSVFGSTDIASHANGHIGLDIDTAPGQLVYAPVSGTVIKAGEAGGYGWAVVIRFGHNNTTYFVTIGHVKPLSSVNEGMWIKAGAPVGRTPQEAGDSTGAHYHFGLSTRGYFGSAKNQDPERFMARKNVKLCGSYTPDSGKWN